MKRALTIFMFLFMCFSSYSQDPQFSQFYSIPLYLNPAFAGNTTQGRVSYNHRIQWPSIPGAFKSYAFTYDQNLSSVNSGIGLMFMRDKAGSGGLRFTNIGGMYSYTIQIDRRHAIKPAMHLSYTMRDIDFSNLEFGDQLIRGGGVSTSEQTTARVSYMDVSSGMVFYSTHYWIGAAVHHLNKPNQSLLSKSDKSLVGGEANLPRKASVHAGYNIPVKKKVNGDVATSITLAANYKAEKKWDQLDLGFYFTVSPIVFGVWYRGIPLVKAYEPGYMNNDAAIFMVGYQTKGFKIGYSYDVTISRLISNTSGSHEISLTYEFASPNSQRKRTSKRFLVPCAKF